MAKHILPENFRYVAAGGEGDLKLERPASFLPERKSPVLCRYDICELLESYHRRCMLPALGTSVPSGPGAVRMRDVPCGLYTGWPRSSPYPGGLSTISHMFRFLFEAYRVDKGYPDGFLFLDHNVALSGIAGSFAGHYTGSVAAVSGVATTDVTTFTPTGTNGQYNSSTVEGDPVRTHSETERSVTLPEKMPLPCVNDFTWGTEVETVEVNNVSVRLPKHHLHYLFEDDRGSKYGNLDTVSATTAKATHFCAALPFLPSATRLHKKGYPSVDPDLVDSHDDVDMHTALDAVDRGPNVSAESLYAVAGTGPMGADSTSCSVAPGPYYGMDYWSHYRIKEDYGGSDRLKESFRMFRPPGLFPVLPATFLAGRTRVFEPSGGGSVNLVDYYVPTWWPDPETKRKLDSARDEAYRYYLEHFPRFADRYKDPGIDCMPAEGYYSTGIPVRQHAYGGDSAPYRQYSPGDAGVNSYRYLTDMPPCIPDVLYPHLLKSAYAWRGRLVKTLHPVDVKNLLFSASETVDSQWPGDDRYGITNQQVKATGSLAYRGGVEGGVDALPGGAQGVAGLNGFLYLPAAAGEVPAYDGYRDRYGYRLQASFKGTLKYSEFTPLLAWNGCPKTVRKARSGKTETTRIYSDGEQGDTVETPFADDPVDASDKEPLASKLISDDRWPFVKEARLFLVVDVDASASIGGWANDSGNREQAYTDIIARYENGSVVSLTGRDGTVTSHDEQYSLAVRAAGSLVVDLGAINPGTGKASGTLDVYALLEGLRRGTPSYGGSHEGLSDIFRGFGLANVTRDGGFDHTYRFSSYGSTVTWNPSLPEGAVNPPSGYTGTGTTVVSGRTVEAFCGDTSHEDTVYRFGASVKIAKAFVAIEWDFEAGSGDESQTQG